MVKRQRNLGDLIDKYLFLAEAQSGQLQGNPYEDI